MSVSLWWIGASLLMAAINLFWRSALSALAINVATIAWIIWWESRQSR